ncbi:MAG: hypothetical protein ACKV1O_20280 [Saprospiraceae bacterium]
MMEKETDQLEPQQYKRLYWESDVPVRDLRVRLMRRLLYAALILFASLCVIAAMVKFPDQIELPFVLKTDIREEVYKFPYPVYLLEQYVQPGDSVRPGMRLLRITSPEIVSLINRYNETQSGSENFNASRRAAELRQQEIIRASIRQNLLSIEERRRQLELSRQTRAAQERELLAALQEARDKLAAYKNLRANEIGSQFDLVEQQTRLAQAENALRQEKLRFEKDSAGMQNAIGQLLLDNQMAESRLAESGADFRADSIDTASNFDLARRRIANSFGDCEIADGSIIVKSALHGRVSFLFEGEKEIRDGATAIKINNDNEPTYGFVKCPPAVVGKLNPNQHCHLKVFSFPFYEYGAAKGHIREVSLSPDEKGDYNLQIALDDPGRLKGLLQPGLNGTAVVVIEEKTLLQYFFRGLNKQYRRFLDGEALSG